MTEGKHPLELLADWLEAERVWNAADEGSVAECNARDVVEPLYDALLSLDPAALRAQAAPDPVAWVGGLQGGSAGLAALASEWRNRAQAIYLNLPSDNEPLAHTQISTAHTLEQCADALTAALSATEES